MTSKQETLQQAYNARVDEVEHYQLNIDNYKDALCIIEQDQDPDLEEFKSQLKELLRTSIIEQKKAKIMLTVLSNKLEN